MQPVETTRPPKALPPDGPEFFVSLALVCSVLGVLTLAKAVMQVPYLGAASLTFAAFWQLRAPLWRAERQGLGLPALGCHLGAWRLDLRLALTLAGIVLPLYALGYHVVITLLVPLCLAGWPALDIGLQAGHLAWHVPDGLTAWAGACLWFGERALTHTLGVALPEELFYRGYVQPVWQARFAARHKIAGAPMGLATVAVCVAFALGHFLGEWHLGRLGPFFPSLLFAWQRTRSGTIVGAVGLHALCNLFAEVWIRQYAPGP